MKSRTLIAIWKANMPPLVWGASPAWIGAVILGLNGSHPDWDKVALFSVTIMAIQAITEFANSYVDRSEDKVYFTSNPLVTGEFQVETAKKAFVVENIIIGTLVLTLSIVTTNYLLIIVILAYWFAGIAYSLRPFKFKATLAGPLFIALVSIPLPLAGWLIAAPLNNFIIAFTALFFLHSFGYGITHKFRKTYHALRDGLIRLEPGSSVYNLKNVDLGMRVKTALTVEAIATLGAFCLVPVLWYFGIFNAALSVALLALPLPFTVWSIIIRLGKPIENMQKGVMFMTISWALIILCFFAVSLATLIPWGFAILTCIIFLIVFALLLRTVHPFSLKAVSAPWQEL
ncbi:MAG: UbiA family prenyltransferase [Methanotrichaceae archaeon]|nr:UbiA family prenyltransferase [Methanotrichaceae archaeon]